MVEQDDQDLEKLSKEQLQELVRQLRTDTVAHQRDSIEAEAPPVAGKVGFYSGPPPPHSETEILAAYRQVLAERCAVSLPGGVDPTREKIAQWPALEQVFVDLSVNSAESATNNSADSPQSTQSDSLLDVIIQHRRLVVLGTAGSGKTTLLRRLCLALTGDCWQGLERWPEDERDYLPLLVDMREFARWLAARPALPDAFAALLWTHISEQLAERNLTFAEDALANAVAKGQALMLVDNLQDVPQRLQKTVVDTLTDFAKSYHRCRLVVTSQAPNSEQAPQLPEKRFPSVTLMPLDKPRIDRIIGAWYADSPQESLRIALNHPDFVPLRTQPLTLTLLLWLGIQHPPLAKRLSGLCIQAATALWQQQADGVSMDALRILGLTALAVFIAADADPAAVLPQLTMHEDALLSGLAELSEEGDSEKARKTLLSICNTGLLVEKEPATYGFLHPLLGTYVLSQPLAQDSAFVGHALKLACTQRTLACLLVPLACAYKAHIQQDWEPVLDLLNTLCELDKEKLTGHKIWLAGDIVTAVGAAELCAHKSGADRLEQVAQGLATVLEQDQLQPAERAHIGDILGSLGDPRFAEQRLHLPFSYRKQPETGLGFVFIRPGNFWMGSQSDNPQANPNELGNANPLQIVHPFWMARYPVTVAQYGAFIAAEGYVTAAWWRNEVAAKWLLDTQRQVPEAWTQQCWHPNWPVTGITWFEALAYCHWLDAQLRAPDKSPIPEDYEVRLPTEAEWEKAARSATRSQFPWGNDAWTAHRANVDASGLHHPTPVGMYPQGATLTELFDMAGNVWEWTLSGAKKYPYDPTCNHLPTTSNRIVRGGSWQDPPALASCTARRIQAADECRANIGLRLVLSVTRSAFSRYQLF